MHESLKLLDEIQLNFSADSLFLLNITLAFIMFGVALELKAKRFKHVRVHAKKNPEPYIFYSILYYTESKQKRMSVKLHK